MFAAKHLLSWFWEKEKEAMFSKKILTCNQALHPPINAFNMLHHSNLHTQWLQEYFIKPENLALFLDYLGAQLKRNDVRLINATIRPIPKDTISILPYAEEDRYAVVICFAQKKTAKEIEKTKQWIKNINAFLASNEGIFYQAYMPYATQEQFETCYGKSRIAQMRALKKKFDPKGVFSNAHTKKYFDKANCV